MQNNNIHSNEKTPSAMLRVFKFGSKKFDGLLPNVSIIHLLYSSVNPLLPRCHTTPAGFAMPSRMISYVTDNKSTTPRTVRQSHWNLLEMGTPSTVLVFTMQERAVVVSKINK